MKDSATRLFFLKQPAPVVLLARSYTDDTNLLWQLHLRHGHRNFADIARQYKLKLPQSLPACTSCIMGKSHVHPHLSTGFERATRVAEGFHSDFRGPFSVPTDKGEAYLLTLVDDYSRRIFGFLAKSQSEWMDIWTQFVTRVEAELGKTNCIAWVTNSTIILHTQATTPAPDEADMPEELSDADEPFKAPRTRSAKKPSPSKAKNKTNPLTKIPLPTPIDLFFKRQRRASLGDVPLLPKQALQTLINNDGLHLNGDSSPYYHLQYTQSLVLLDQ